NMKTRGELEHIDGGVVNLFDIEGFPKLRRSAPNGQITIDGSKYRDQNDEFVSRFLTLPNTCMEYFHLYSEFTDAKLLHYLGRNNAVKKFISKYAKEILELEHDNQKQAIRRRLANELWFTEDKERLQERDEMISDVMRLQMENFEYCVSACPTLTSFDQTVHAEDINDKCQAIAYLADKECASYFQFDRKCLKQEDTMARYFEYVRKNSWATLNVLRFPKLDLHYPIDYRARDAFKHFKEEVAEIKKEFPKKAFMLLEGGNQTFLASEVFDIVSTSLTGIESEGRGYGHKYQGYWWDEVKMHTRDPSDVLQIINRDHCNVCYAMTEDIFHSKAYNSRRRQHRLNDLDKRFHGTNQSIRSKNIGVYMRRELAPTEFSTFKEMILSP
ncbi:MAG: hypothetical protein ACREBS_11390, partial [Nitrososphaerales archaeon]